MGLTLLMVICKYIHASIFLRMLMTLTTLQTPFREHWMWSQKAKILMVALSPAGGEMRPHCFGLLFNESLRLLISDTS